MKARVIDGRKVACAESVMPESIIGESVVNGRYVIEFREFRWDDGELLHGAGRIVCEPVESGKPNIASDCKMTPEDLNDIGEEFGGVLSESFSVWRERGRRGSPGLFWSLGVFDAAE